MVFNEHLTNHNQEEVKADLAFLVEKQCIETKSNLANFKQEISEQFTDATLIKTIKTLFQTPTGERNEHAFDPNVTSAYDFTAQLGVIRCGFPIALDSDFWSASQEWVKKVKELYNRLCTTDWKPAIAVDGHPNSWFFQAVLELMPLIPRAPVGTRVPTEKSPNKVKSNMLLDTVQTSDLDAGKTISIADPAAQQGRIEQFIPARNYKIVLDYSQTKSPYKKHTAVVATRNWSTYVVVDPTMPHGKDNRAFIYPGIQVTKVDEKSVAKIETQQPKIIEEIPNKIHTETSTSLTVDLVFSSLLTKYESIKPDFLKFVNDFNLSADKIKRLAQLIYSENTNFSKRRRNYTPIGQVGRAARIDWHTHLWINPPAWSKKNWYNQLVGCYGYADKCGIFSTDNPSSLWEAYAKYNLWLYHKTQSFSKIKRMFYKQADELVAYAKSSARKRWSSDIAYEDITHAQYKYYTKGQIG
jgi:hypothetical protein